mgnify:CR=1 FL=1
MVWYAHPKTLTFKLTALPVGYPDGFVFPEGVTPNKAGYFDRGWCFCESSVSNLVKDSYYVLDLAKFDESVTRLNDVVRACIAKRAPPLAPADFSVELATKRFTSAKADRETVRKLYEGEFEEKLGEATMLQYSDLQWTDAEVATLCKALASGKATKLEELYLQSNQIGDAGAAALAEVAGKLPQLKYLHLFNNPKISQQAKDALKAALPNCEVNF